MKKLFKVLTCCLVATLLLAGCGEKKPEASTDNKTQVQGYTWAQTYDALIAKIKSTSDAEARFKMMHEAEDMLMKTGAITPVYNYTQSFLVKPSLTNYYASPLGYKVFSYALKDGKAGGTTTILLASEPATLDPTLNSAMDGATYAAMSYSGLMGFLPDEKGEFKLLPDLAADFPKVEKLDGEKVSYTFTLRDGLKWSDGSELKASDFVYAWNRAVDPKTAADYAYLYEGIDGYADATSGKGTLNLKADDAARTFTVVLTVDCPYFLDLCVFPTFLPVKQSSVEANPDAWASEPKTAISTGAYKLVKKETGKQLVYEKNEHYWNAKNVTMKTVVFALSDDDAASLANYKTGSYDFTSSFPSGEVKTLRETLGSEFVTMPNLGTYYIGFNVNDPVFKDFTEPQREQIRLALGLLIDRNNIVENITQTGQTPAAGFVASGIFEADRKTEYVTKNGFNRDGKGYFNTAKDAYADNCKQAVEMLKKVADESGKFTYKTTGDVTMFEGFPTIPYLLNNGTGHVKVAQYLQGVYKSYGIDFTIDAQEWAVFLATRKDGNYSVARNGWIADYNDPISFLDMWTSQSGNNDCQFGKGDHANYAGYEMPASLK